MKKHHTLWALFLGLAALAIGAAPLRAQQQSSSPDQIRVIVTVEGSKENPNPTVTKDDVVVFQNKDRRPVTNWVAATGDNAALDLAILIDDSSNSNLGLQMDDIREFIGAQAPTTRIAIAYGINGSAQVRQNFTADREAVNKALRLPMGRIGLGASIYMSLEDLLGKWPPSPARREVLLISSGIDTYYGMRESTPGLNMSLDRAISRAERGGVVVYSIYASAAGHRMGQGFLVNNGQSSLSRLADETGGEVFLQAGGTPIAFKPYLAELSQLLGQQYLLTFQAALGKKAKVDRLRLTAEQKGAELTAQDHVYVPAAAK